MTVEMSSPNRTIITRRKRNNMSLKHTLNSLQVEEARRKFLKHDKDKSNHIEFSELKEVLESTLVCVITLKQYLLSH
jgi:Ca2+-binding EF-hand superfamily protein